MLKNSFSLRLLKKVQMQGGVTHLRWVPGEVRDVLGTYVAAPHPPQAGTRRAGYPPQVGHRRWAFFSGLLGTRHPDLVRLHLGFTPVVEAPRSVDDGRPGPLHRLLAKVGAHDLAA